MAGYAALVDQYYTLKLNCTNDPFALYINVSSNQSYTGDASSDFGIDNQTDGDAFLVSLGEAMADVLTNATGCSLGTVTFVYAQAPGAPRQILP